MQTPSDRPEDAKRNIACALGVDPESVNIERCERDLSGWVFRCTGTCKAQRIFAKTYLANYNPPFRRIPAFVLPWEELALLREPGRLFGGQIDVECQSIQRLNGLMGDGHIPALLGKSAACGTLVFGEVAGVRMDRRVQWSGWARARWRSNIRVVFEAGKWLRNVHDVTSEGNESVDACEVTDVICEILRLKGLESTRYGKLALKLFEQTRSQLGDSGKVDVPVCLQHGDFSLPNLIWNDRDQRLWIIDLEHSKSTNIFQDLGSIIFNLRSKYLYPMTSQSVVTSLEEALWAGYGKVPSRVVTMTNAIATARIFYHLLPKLLTRRARRGWVAGITASAYRRFVEPLMIERILKAPVPA